MRTRGMVLGVVCTALLLAPGRAHADVGGPEIIGFVNAQRAANGIPGDIVEDPTLSADCAAHDAYGAQNDVLQHFESQGAPGYSEGGDFAAQNSILYEGNGPWTASVDPFETAPIHLHQLLAPRIDRAGAAELSGYGCLTTLASRNRPAPVADVTYTYPADGQVGWRASEVAAESPYTPGQEVGIPAGTETGPYLYVTFDGPDLTPFDAATATSATLAGPDGPVDLAVVDNATPGLEGYLPTGMELIPRLPLAPQTTYTATVSAAVTTQGGAGPSRPFSHTWSFTTGARDNAIRILGAVARGRRVTVDVQSSAPDAAVVAAGSGTTTGARVDAGGTAELALDADGSWRLCALSGGGSTGWTSANDCTSVSVRSGAGGGSGATATGRTPGRPGRLGFTRRGQRVTVRWLAVPRAVGYRVSVRVGGRVRILRTRRTHVAFRVAPHREARVTVRGLSASGVLGPASPRATIPRAR